MANTSKLSPKSDRDIFYYRQRARNRRFEAITAFYAEEAERRGITKKDIAECLGRDPAQITRWLTAPSNITSDSESDLLLALDAEMDHSVARFVDRPQPNYVHPLIDHITKVEVKRTTPPPTPDKTYQPRTPVGTDAMIITVEITS